MTQDEIEKVFDERIRSARTKIENMQRDFSERKDMLIQEIGDQVDDRINILQNEIDNLEIAKRVLAYIPHINFTKEDMGNIG